MTPGTKQWVRRVIGWLAVGGTLALVMGKFGGATPADLTLVVGWADAATGPRAVLLSVHDPETGALAFRTEFSLPDTANRHTARIRAVPGEYVIRIRVTELPGTGAPRSARWEKRAELRTGSENVLYLE